MIILLLLEGLKDLFKVTELVRELKPSLSDVQSHATSILETATGTLLKAESIVSSYFLHIILPYMSISFYIFLFSSSHVVLH